MKKDLKIQNAFTLAEGATHVGIFHITRRVAFTLAEVLITLGIIGIVSAMTIPTLINNYQKKSLISAIKVTYTTLSQGIQMLMYNNNCFDDIECTGAFNGTYTDTSNADWNKTFFSKMGSVFKISEKCENINDNCKLLKKYKHLSEDYIQDMSTNQYRVGFVLSNGAYVTFNNSKSQLNSENNKSQIKKIISYLVIDVNGSRGPNTFGRDLFQLILAQNGKLYTDVGIEYAKAKYGDEWATSPGYWRNNSRMCGTIRGEILPNTSGINCLERILEENWEMNY